MGALGWVGGAAARRFGRHVLLGLALPLYPGFVLTLARNLNEILAAVLLAGGLLAVHARRPLAGAGLLSLAVLARETTVVAVAGMALVWAVARLRRTAGPPAVTFLFPLGVEAAWLIILRLRWGRFPFQEAGGNLGLPLVAPLRFLLGAAGEADPYLRVAEVVGLALLIILIGLVLACLRASDAPSWIKAGWLLSLGLLLSLSGVVWVEDWAFLRAATELYVLGFLVVVATSGLAAPLLGAATMVGAGVAAGSRLYHI